MKTHETLIIIYLVGVLTNLIILFFLFRDYWCKWFGELLFTMTSSFLFPWCLPIAWTLVYTAILIEEKTKNLDLNQEIWKKKK